MTTKEKFPHRITISFSNEQIDWLQNQVCTGNAEYISQFIRKLVNAAMWTTETKEVEA